MKNKLIISICILCIIIILIFVILIINKNIHTLSSDISKDADNIPIIQEDSEDIKISENEQDTSVEEDNMIKINVIINGKNFSATLYDNKTVKELINKLPLTINMSELNGNEKYYYFNDNFTTLPERVGTIKSGDLMLYGSDCLVLFYDSFSTSYSYTKIGYLDNPEGLKNIVGNGTVNVVIENVNN